MRNWLHGLLALGLSCMTVGALEVQVDQSDANRQACAGMYSRKTWGGPVDPHILVKFIKNDGMENADPVVSMVIFEWEDYDLVGVVPQDDTQREYICDPEAVQNKWCNVNQTGQFLMAENATERSNNLIYTEAVHLKDPGQPVNYEVKKTGYFCVGSAGYTPEGVEYIATVEFRNAFGELPAAQIAKLPFYGGLTIVYAVVGVFWGFLYFQYRHDILAVQNYITAIIILLIIEMLMTWGFYDFMNRNGSNVGSKAMMVVVAILNSGRNSFSFFLLLIVCMGYGVVKPTLGRTMVHVRWLAGGHFVFGLIYSIASLTITPEHAGPLVLLVILPLAATLTAFYVWTLNALNATMKDLNERKQTTKAQMYRNLWWCILVSIAVIFAFFFFNSFTFASAADPDFVPKHWRARWFILDGWLNIVYLADVIFIAYIWRPTAHNRRFAMSDELAQDDEGFEIADFGVEEDEDDEENAGGNRGDRAEFDGPRYDPAPTHHATRNIPRESLDGETIFAVGDDHEDADRWSEEGSDEDAKGKLVGGKKSD